MPKCENCRWIRKLTIFIEGKGYNSINREKIINFYCKVFKSTLPEDTIECNINSQEENDGFLNVKYD